MTDAHPSTAAVEGLRKHAHGRSAAARRRISRAIDQLDKSGATINVAAVANKANVARKTIYSHNDLLDRIRAHAREVAAAPDPIRTDSSIVEALRSQLTAKDKTIKELRTKIREQQNTIAHLYGELTRNMQ